MRQRLGEVLHRLERGGGYSSTVMLNDTADAPSELPICSGVAAAL
jgi:hypothetical protein